VKVHLNRRSRSPRYEHVRCARAPSDANRRQPHSLPQSQRSRFQLPLPFLNRLHKFNNNRFNNNNNNNRHNNNNRR